MNLHTANHQLQQLPTQNQSCFTSIPTSIPTPPPPHPTPGCLEANPRPHSLSPQIFQYGPLKNKDILKHKHINFITPIKMNHNFLTSVIQSISAHISRVILYPLQFVRIRIHIKSTHCNWVMHFLISRSSTHLYLFPNNVVTEETRPIAL